MAKWMEDFESVIASDDELRLAARLGRVIGKGVDDFNGKCESWTMYDHAGKMYLVPDRLMRAPPDALPVR